VTCNVPTNHVSLFLQSQRLLYPRRLVKCKVGVLHLLSWKKNVTLEKLYCFEFDQVNLFIFFYEERIASFFWRGKQYRITPRANYLSRGLLPFVLRKNRKSIRAGRLFINEEGNSPWLMICSLTVPSCCENRGRYPSAALTHTQTVPGPIATTCQFALRSFLFSPSSIMCSPPLERLMNHLMPFWTHGVLFHQLTLNSSTRGNREGTKWSL
jgi:hypothetical protein